MNKKILFLVFITLLSTLPYIVNAQASALLSMVTNLSQNLVAIGAALSTIAFIVAGIMFLSATGNPTRMTVAKGALIAAVIGIIIISLAGVAQTFVKGIFCGAGCQGSYIYHPSNLSINTK